ncbi:MAG: sugar phosphate isomerase/epimerase [Tannerella sp.]|nr:sugar phosphate isomerase/epimerase [Tannerella sp.]
MASVSIPSIIKSATTNDDFTACKSVPVCAFVKPFEKYGYDNIAVLLSESGFDGADITLRKGGLIIPETAKTELPKLIKSFAEKNISVPMAVSGIQSAYDPDTENIIRIMSDNGISYYRLGAINYDKQMSVSKNLDILKKNMEKLSELNLRYKIHGDVQNHVGSGFGAPVWDIYLAIKDCDPEYLGIQYDIRHAVAEGMASWSLGLNMALEYVCTTCIKDFTWEKYNKTFRPVSVPLGEGIVDFKQYFEIIGAKTHRGPVSIHYEYPLLDDSKTNVAVNEQIKSMIPKIKRDLDVYKQMQKNYH